MFPRFSIFQRVRRQRTLSKEKLNNNNQGRRSVRNRNRSGNTFWVHCVMVVDCVPLCVIACSCVIVRCHSVNQDSYHLHAQVWLACAQHVLHGSTRLKGESPNPPGLWARCPGRSGAPPRSVVSFFYRIHARLIPCVLKSWGLYLSLNR